MKRVSARRHQREAQRTLQADGTRRLGGRLGGEDSKRQQAGQGGQAGAGGLLPRGENITGTKKKHISDPPTSRLPVIVKRVDEAFQYYFFLYRIISKHRNSPELPDLRPLPVDGRRLAQDVERPRRQADQGHRCRGQQRLPGLRVPRGHGQGQEAEEHGPGGLDLGAGAREEGVLKLLEVEY